MFTPTLERASFILDMSFQERSMSLGQYYRVTGRSRPAIHTVFEVPPCEQTRVTKHIGDRRAPDGGKIDFL